MFSILNIIGLITFSFSGALKGIKKKFDLFGIVVLGTITALGGGVVRDILVNQLPKMLTDSTYIGFSLLGILIAILLRKKTTPIIERIFLISDAIGLSSFTSTGCIIAYENNLSIIGMLLLGLSTAIGGGIMRDILSGDVPLVLCKEFYASCSILGCLVFYFSITSGFSVSISSLLCVLIVFIIRLMAIKYNWHLPYFS
ncbi:MAG: trimeric intracellular cation channel family protein [Candidatus Omnitrophica bacterium]|nr:trimeric intracellular cation channel family protein [Candidatus Omnitrophota bacterium]